MNRRDMLGWTMGAAFAGLWAGCGGSGDDSTKGAQMLSFDSVTTADGVRLNVVQTGNPLGPAIVFVHGISQSWLSWVAQLGDGALRSRYRLIAFDLRGHGASQGSQVAVDADGAAYAPLADAAYNNGNAAETAALWAADLQAVIGGLALTAPTVVGWSYGGAVLLDCIAQQRGLGAIGKAVLLATSPVLLAPGVVDGGADTVFSGATFAALLGTTPVNVANGHVNTNAEIAAGLGAFVDLCYQDGAGRAAPSAAQVQGVTGYNLYTPPAVRLDIIARAFDYRAMLASLASADRARIRVIAPQGDQVLQPANILGYWGATGLTVDALPNEGHLYHYRNAPDFNARLATVAG